MLDYWSGEEIRVEDKVLLDKVESSNADFPNQNLAVEWAEWAELIAF